MNGSDPAPTVSNSSPLIALAQIGELELLLKLFPLLLVPPAVVRETAPSVTLPGWIKTPAVRGRADAPALRGSLGEGETEAIALALEVRARWIVLDDRAARQSAHALRLPVIGTLGILLAAKRRGWLPAVRPALAGLIRHGFHIAPELHQHVLADAGE